MIGSYDIQNNEHMPELAATTKYNICATPHPPESFSRRM